MIKPNETDLMILTHFIDDYKTINSIIGKLDVSSATIYRRVRKLCSNKYLDQKDKKYKISEKGILVIQKKKPNNDWNALEGKIPQLRIIELEYHRAAIELILASIVSRRDEVAKDHHPTFVLFGPTAKFKTWIVKVVCAILGKDYEKHIILMTSEDGKSIFVRKGSRGEIVTRRKIMDYEFVCFDELHKASIKTKNLCFNFLQGEMVVSLENDTITFHPVPIITYNPKKGEEHGSRIMFEPQNVRRSVLLDFGEIEIPDEIKPNGSVILKRMNKMGKIKLEKHKSDCEKYRKSIFNFLNDCKTKDIEFIIDTDMILLMCAGMTSFFEDEKRAILIVLHRYLTLISTLGYLKEDWLAKLNLFKRKMIEIEPINLDLEEIESEKKEDEDDIFSDIHISNGLNYDDSMEKIKKGLKRCNVQINDFDEFLDDYIIVVKKGENIKWLIKLTEIFDPEYINGVIKNIEDYSDLKKQISDMKQEVERLKDLNYNLCEEIIKHGSSQREIIELMDIKKTLVRLEIYGDQLSGILAVHKSQQDLGLDDRQMNILAQEIKRHGKDALGDIFRIRKEYNTVEEGLISKQAEYQRYTEAIEESDKILKRKKNEVEEEQQIIVDKENKINEINDKIKELEHIPCVFG